MSTPVAYNGVVPQGARLTGIYICNGPVGAVSGAPVPWAENLAGGTIGTAYSESLSTSGGTAPYTYSLQSGSIPAGCTLSSSGVISGTPTTAATYTFTVLVTDANGITGTQTFQIIVMAAASSGGGSYPFLS